jgi:hypothetical protein
VRKGTGTGGGRGDRAAGGWLVAGEKRGLLMSSAEERRTGTAGTGTARTDQPTGTDVSRERAGAHRAPGYEGGYREPAEYEGRSVWATGGSLLASVLMIFSGLVTVFVGITGMIRGAFFPTVPNYTFYFSVYGRGLTDLIIGAVILAAGVCLLMGMTWARVVGVVLAVISGIANFLFLPYAPLWSIVVIALSIFIIWALTTGGRHRYA